MKKKILVLEDDEINQKLIELYLIDDYDITILGSVKEATKIVSASS